MGGSKKTTKSKSKTENKISPWLREGSEHAVRRAREIADRDYTSFSDAGGNRIAELNENERMGMNMARDNAGAWEGDFATARAKLDSVGSITDEGALDGYFNPYMDRVVSPALRRKNEAFEAARAERRANRGMSGAFGGRGQMWENKFESDFQRDQDEFMGEAYGRAFDAATSLYNQEMDRRLDTATAYQSLGAEAQNQRRQDMRQLFQSGLVERTRDQADLDFKYLEHLEERDWDVNNLNTLVSTLSAVPHETTQLSESKTTETTKDSPMKTVAGVASMAAGAMMTGGMSALGGALTSGGMGMLGMTGQPGG